MNTKLISIATGVAQTYGKNHNKFQSAYKKNSFYNFIDISQYGISTDKQVDKSYHGGVDKAIHIGSIKHFGRFKEQYSKELDKLAIGCNIFVDNFDEDDICIGDIYSIGDIEVEVSQPRQPCWKIGAIFDKDTSRYIIKNNATGWYVRVLNEGTLDINDQMILEKRVSDITIKQLSQYLHIVPTDKTLVDKILTTKALADAYKDDFKRLLKKSR